MTYKMGDKIYDIGEIMWMEATETIFAEDDDGEYTIPVHHNFENGIFEFLTDGGDVYDRVYTDDWK